MQLLPALKYGVIISFFISVISLSILVLRTFSFGKRGWHPQPLKSMGSDVVKNARNKEKVCFFCKLLEGISTKPLYAEPKGDVKKGILYAFGKGMMPWEKESAGKHLPSYIGGILYHLGVFTGFFYLCLTLVSVDLPALVLLFMRILLAAGVISGVALLLKRIFSPQMRVLSCPDDFAANIIVNIFVLTALLHTFYPITHLFFLAAIVMFLYMPLGKIRHCFFFFYTRILFGMFFGRRDILPPKAHFTIK